MHRLSLVVRLLLLLIAASAFPATAAPLQAQWQFRMLPGDSQGAAHPGLHQWRAAKVPGSVHTDLLAHALIRDPYVGAPEAELQWIGLAAWEYRARFDVDAATLAKPNAELRFDGLDTYAEVSLNGKPLQRTFLRHDEILAGGELRFTMQAEPNKDWPGQGAQAPYSMSR